MVEKRVANNELVIGFDRPETQGLYARRCRVGQVSLVNGPGWEERDLTIRPRYRAPAEKARVVPGEDGTILDVTFETPQRALTPGQVCAFYDGEVLVGGGIFEEIHN